MDENATNQSAPNQPPKEEPKSNPSYQEVVREVHHHHHYHRGGIARLFFGLLFLVIGLGFFAQSMGWISGLDFGYVLSRIWPVFIILLGAVILSRGTWVGSVLSILIIIAVMGLIFASFFWPGAKFSVETTNFDIAKEVNAARAEISITGGASSIQIAGGAQGLVLGSLESNITKLATNSQLDGNIQKVKIDNTGNWHGFGVGLVNRLQAKISEDVPIDMAIDAGASSLNLDFSSIQLESLQIKSGASSLHLILGDKVATSTVNINAGASSINISLPRDVGIRLAVKADLSSKNFPDFVQVDKNNYESSNYSSAAKKIDIRIDSGVSSISTSWR